MAAVVPAGAPAGQSSQVDPAPFTQVAAGAYHTCALVDEGITPAPAGVPVRCWGFSGDGQVGYGNRGFIGDNEPPGAAGPIDLGPGRTAKALAAGDYHSCAVLDDGAVRCWGYGDEGQLGYGNRNQIGDDEVPAAVGPVNLGAGRTATAITAGGNHTCALLDDGNVRCWGLGEQGQLGYGMLPGSLQRIGDGEDPGVVGPIDFAGHTAKAITAGQFHTCAILDDDSVRCWGRGGNGQLGYGDTGTIDDPGKAGPVDLGPGRTARAISAGRAHTCAILDNGSVRCWGLNQYGQLGYGNTLSVGDIDPPSSAGPVDLGPGRTAVAISTGGLKTCAVLDDGSVRCWGLGSFGQLGYGNLDNVGDDESPASVEPVDLGPGAKATAVAAGIFHTCARLDDRSVRCWGDNAAAELGLCSIANIGDDEVPAAVERVDLGAGGAACPPPIPASPTPGATVVPPPPSPGGGPAPPDSAQVLALRAQEARAAGLRACRSAATGRQRSDRARALRLYGSGSRLRTRALRTASRRAARARARCLSRFARIPGRVTTLAARADSSTQITLTFQAAGTDGSKGPAARSYLVKQSPRPIRTARDFRRASALCRAACTFDVTAVRASLKLDVTDLRRSTRYYYAVAARDNVSRRTGPRSRTVSVRTR